ncbi:MAG: nuclear transport factor 2 family protein [Acidimicrobiales bacterium]
MSMNDDLTALERRGWEALSTDGAAGPFYDETLVEEPLMLLPSGMVIDDRTTIVESMSGAPRDGYDLEDMRVVPLGDDAAVVAYGATADRGDTHVSSLFNSTYVRRDGAWRLAVHQQTPR